MFYKTGIDITNDKQMFNFLRDHFEYYTANSWNGLRSIANNVKMYNLGLSGDWCVALSILEAEDYDTINMMILDWEREHYGYNVGFNGRSGGYLVLTERGSCCHVLHEDILNNDDYEEYKQYCREYYGSVKANRWVLVKYTKLVQAFDKLCDDLRDYCDMLSKSSFEILEMQKAVDDFNYQYYPDLDYLGFQELQCDVQGIVDLSEILNLRCLADAFLRVADRRKVGYSFEWLPDNRLRLKRS